MDTKPEDQTPEATNSGQVMDVSVPKPVTVTDGDAPAVEAPEVHAAGSVIEPQKNADVTSDPIVADPAPAEAPVEPAEEPTPTSEAPAPETTPAPEQAPQTPAADTPHDNPMAIPPTTHAHHTPIFAIVVAIVVALGLAGVVVYMYLKKAPKPNDTKTTQSSVVQKPAVSAADVDNTGTAIDNNLKTIDDTKDFVGTDLSDASLGL